MHTFIENIEVRSIPQQISDHIKHEIVTGRLRPGDKLPSLDDLSESMGVSKPTVREALQSLNESGLITIIKGRNGGYFITESYPDKLMNSMYEMITFSLTFNKMQTNDLLEVRKLIEIPCAGLAAERRTENDLEKLQMMKSQLNDCDKLSMQEILHLDLRFHMSIADCTQNPLTKTIINAITKSYLESSEDFNDENKMFIVANSTEVIDAVIAGDVKAAEREMEKHMNYFLIF